MEKSLFLNRPYSSQCLEARLILISFRNDEKIETLEKFRISLNKIRAMYKILKYSGNPEIDIRPRKFMLNLYHRVGEMKDIFNKLHMITVLTSTSSRTCVWHERTLESLKYLFRKNIEKYLEQLIEQEKIHRRVFYRVNRKDVVRYLSSLQERIRQNLFMNCNDESLHKARRILRELLNNATLLEEEQLKSIPIDLSVADNIQELIGQWHDKSIFLEDLENEEECKLMGITDINYRNQLIKSTSSLKITLRKEIDKRIPTLVPIKRSEKLGKLEILQYLEPEH